MAEPRDETTIKMIIGWWKNACSRHVSSYLFASKLSHGLCDVVHVVPYAASEIKKVNCNLQNPNTKKHSHPSDTDWCRLLLSVCAWPLIQLRVIPSHSHGYGASLFIQLAPNASQAHRTTQADYCIALGMGARLFTQGAPHISFKS